MLFRNTELHAGRIAKRLEKFCQWEWRKRDHFFPFKLCIGIIFAKITLKEVTGMHAQMYNL